MVWKFILMVLLQRFLIKNSLVYNLLWLCWYYQIDSVKNSKKKNSYKFLLCKILKSLKIDQLNIIKK